MNRKEKIESITQHEDRNKLDWDDNVLVQPEEGEGSGKNGTERKHFKMSLRKLAPDTDWSEPTDDTPPSGKLVKDSLEQIELTPGPQGDDGLSAYEVAVEEGFVGDETAWLASLKGADGDSAYNVAVSEGFSGTEQEWLASLKGADGDDGLSAYDIYVETTSDSPVKTEEQWLASLKGADGDDGLSAYDIYVETTSDSPVKTEEQWLASLKGADGDDGLSAYDIYVETTSDSPVKTEEQWLASLKGADGDDGLSAYEIAVKEGFVGDETAWLASLKGADGKSAYEYAEEEGYEGTEGEFAEALADVENKIDKSKIVTAWNSPKDNEVPSALLVYNSLDGGGSPGDSVIQLIKDAVDPVKGTGWTDENLVDHEVRLSLLENVMPFESFADVQKVVRAGLARKYLSIGDQFLAEYNGEPTIFNVIGIDHPGLVPTDPRFTHTLALQPQDCLMSARFSAPQAMYNAVTALPAGTYIFTTNGVQYQVTTTVEIPAGGILYIATRSGYAPLTLTSYDADRVTTIETGLVVTPTTGTDNLTPINDHDRCRNGSNGYAESAIRQFLNSNEAVFNWEPQGLYDMPSSYSGTGGFLYQLDPELVAVMGEVENKVALSTYDGGGQATVQDKAFLLSSVEVGLGSEGVSTGESVYEFYDGVTDAERIKLLSGSPRDWWLRSANVGYTHSTRYVRTGGALHHGIANNALGLSPACVIV